MEPKKSKPRKSVKEKVDQALEILRPQVERASEGEAEELQEAIDELEDVLSAPSLTEDQERHIIGYNVETGAPVFMPKG